MKRDALARPGSGTTGGWLAARRIPRRGSEWPFRKQERSEVISENPIMENTLEPSRPGAIAIAAAPPTNWQPVQRIGSIPSMYR